MWYTMNDLPTPDENKEYPIWVKANHNGSKFAEWGYIYDGVWYVRGKELCNIGWEFLAWFDLPSFQK